MRHIPDDELHAYLDQALSRSQCVEIESHLAQCPSCRGERDAIAALRDRTTALLATLAPRRALPPPFELIEARRAAAAVRRRHLVRRAAWAASVVGAAALGWGLNQAARGGMPEPASIAVVAPDTGPAPARTGDDVLPPPAPREAEPRSAEPAAGRAAPSRPGADRTDERRAAPPPARDAAGPGIATPRFAAAESVGAPRSLQVSSSGLPDGLALDGLWRTVSWENAQEEAGGAPAHVDGLPVVQVQVQQAESGKPLMVVAQQLGSGDVIRTIEGPAAAVSSLLRRASQPGSSPWPADSAADGGALTVADGSFVTIHGDRILAISAPGMSSDSLAAIARRVHSASRSR